MELGQYLAVARRRWWIIGAVTALAFAASTYTALRGPCAYQATMRMAVSVIPEPRRENVYGYDFYYPWLSSEYLADDLSEVMRSQAFAQDVSAELGYSLDPATLAGAVRAKKTHRLLDVTVCGSNAAATLSIAEAYERVLNTRLGEYFAMLQANNGAVRIINRPVLGRSTSPGGLVGEIGLRTFVGGLLGLGLAFLLEYLDDRIRSRREVEEILQWPIVGEIPAHGARA